jgi:hypothetical protein
MIFKSHSPAWLVAGLPPAVNVGPRHPPQMTRLPQPLSRVVSADSALADWQQRLARETAMTAVVRRCLPRLLAERVHVRMPPGADPLITTDAGAVAAIVRQRLPELAAALQREGINSSGLRVRVQVRIDPGQANKPHKNQLDRQALQPLGELARRLAPGPLRLALERFVRRVGR